MKIKADNLAATVEKTLSDYVEDVNDVVKQEIKDAGKEAVKELKEKSPKRRLNNSDRKISIRVQC